MEAAQQQEDTKKETEAYHQEESRLHQEQPENHGLGGKTSPRRKKGQGEKGEESQREKGERGKGMQANKEFEQLRENGGAGGQRARWQTVMKGDHQETVEVPCGGCHC